MPAGHAGSTNASRRHRKQDPACGGLTTVEEQDFFLGSF